MKVEKRNDKNKVIREQGLVPGVVYGSGIDPVSIQILETDVRQAYNKYGTSMTFTIDLDGDEHIVYIKDYQTDIMNHSHFLHFDLQKVSSGDTITSDVTLAFLNRDKVKVVGHVLTVSMDELEVEYHVGEGVSSIKVDVKDVTVDEPIYVRDIDVPEGITVLADPDAVVVSLATISEAEVETTTTEEGEIDELEAEDEFVEPEAIKQKSPDEDEDDEEE
ncbi:MAG: 50S ribosomal protein L25 [Candidatus Izimaplasma sp.]|nr:50S ribosomal protein L25 [Candidatus Izimaplasma bacterium]